MNRKEILGAIDKVQVALADGGLAQFAGLLLFDEKNLCCFGDGVAVNVPLKIGFRAALHAGEFREFLRRGEADDIGLEFDGGQIIVSGENSKAGFAVQEFDWSDLPDLGDEGEREWSLLPEGFPLDLGFCLFSAGRGKGMPEILTYLKVTGDSVLSTDSFRVTERKLAGKLEIGDPFLMRLSVAEFLAKADLKEISAMRGQIHYRDSAGVVFSHRVIAPDEYPDVAPYFEVEGGEKISFPDRMLGALGRVSAILSDMGDDRRVNISVGKGSVVLEGKGVSSWATETLPMEYGGEVIRFDVNPGFFGQILSLDCGAVVSDRVMFFSGDRFRHILSLIYEGDEKPKENPPETRPPEKDAPKMEKKTGRGKRAKRE